MMWMAKNMQKRGVALVTVLFFMLVELIAATALFKWLKYMGDSSAAELKKTEAYQASQAGVETVRAWLQYDANDVGAILGYYMAEKVPVRLDSVLAPLQSNRSQKFSVYLVAADVQSYPYKLKFVSTGTGRNGARYSQVAIFDVNGLFQVRIPTESSSVNFTEALFGGADAGINLNVSSAIINGNTTFNTSVKATDHIIVTGDLSVNSSTDVTNLYVYGNLYTCTNLIGRNSTYVRDTLYINGTQTFYGDLYAGGGVDLSGTGAGKAQCSTGSGTSLLVTGNLSTDGNIITPRHSAASPVEVDGNVVVNNGGVLDFPQLTSYTYINQPYTAKFLGNVFIDGGLNGGSHARYTVAPKFALGSSGKTVFVGSSLYRITDSDGYIAAGTYSAYWGGNYVTTPTAQTMYYKSQYNTDVTSTETLYANTCCNKATCAPTDNNVANVAQNSIFYDYSLISMGGYYWSGYNIYRNDIFLQVNGTLVASKPDTSGWGADPMSEYQSEIDTVASGNCSGAHEDDPIQFNKSLLKSSYLHSSTNQGACTDANMNSAYNAYTASFWSTGNTIDRWPLLDSCYEAAKDAGELYQNEWLLIKVSGANGQFSGISSSDTLKNKYIIIFEDSSATSLPATTSSAQAILYFEQGTAISITTNADYRNFFIFSDGDINYNSSATKSTITGSIFLSDCHNISSNNTITATYNSTLTQSLAEAAAICNNDGTSTCSTTAEETSSSSTSTGSYDSYYVSTSPRLKIALESEYANGDIDVDTLTTGNSKQAIPSSVVVLPRVIYLPTSTDIAAPLSSFYHAMRLNDSAHTTVSGSVSCEDNSIPTTGSLGTLTGGVYTCTFTPSESSYNSCKFWIVVNAGSTTTTVTSSASAATSSSSSATTLASSSSIASSSSVSSSSVSSSSVVVSSSDAYTVTNCYFGTTPVTVGGSTVFNGTLNGVSSLTSVTLRATGATDEIWSSVTKTIAHIMQYVPTTAGIYSYQLLYNEKELCTADLTVVAASSSSSVTSSSSAGCTESDWIIPQNNNNETISGTFVNGCYKFNTGKACSNGQVHVSGSGSSVLNGTTYSCDYRDGAITALPVITLSASSTCTITQLYVSNCNTVASSSSAVSSSSATSSSSAKSVLMCNSGNSTTMSREVETTIAANTCLAFPVASGSLQVGSWYAASTPVSIQILKCDGSVETISHNASGWMSVSTGSCTIDALPDKTLKLKFSN